jgi:hypothetical protein
MAIAAPRLLRISPYILLLTFVNGTLVDVPMVHAIGEFTPGGSRAAGMGDAYVGWAAGAEGVLWNPGSVATGETMSAVLGYDRPFEIRELETVSVASVLRLDRLGFGFQYQGTQVSTLSESTRGMTIGLRIKEVGGGVRVRHIETRVPGRSAAAMGRV